MIYFLYLERFDRMHEKKVFFLFFSYIFCNISEKSGILIPDLYFYSIKIQININKNW
jgi:hypothetical protein